MNSNVRRVYAYEVQNEQLLRHDVVMQSKSFFSFQKGNATYFEKGPIASQEVEL
jgi:hypothetical protein